MTAVTRARASDVAALAALAAGTLVLFAEAVFGGRVFFERDILTYWYPQVWTLVRTVDQGSWPLWDAYEGFGIPLLADPGSQLVYPTTWLNFVLLPPTVYTVMVVSHTFWAGTGAYFLARHRGLSRLASLVTAWAWCASGPFLSAANLYHHFCGAAWIPWVVLAADRLREDPRAASASRLGLTAAAQALAGSADMCLATALAVALEAAASARRSTRAHRTAQFRAFAVSILLAGSIAAVQWLPTLSLLPSAGRAQFQPANNLYWSVHPSTVPDAFVPGLIADLPFDAAARARLFEAREPFLASLYLGVAALAAVLMARGRQARGTLLLVVVFALLALGRHTPVGQMVLTTFPFRLFRYPVKYTVPMALFWALLAGVGLDELRRGTAVVRRALVVAALLGIVAILAALSAGFADARPGSAGLAVGSLPEFAEWGGVLLSRKLWTVATLAAAGAVLAGMGAMGATTRRYAAVLLALLVGGDLLVHGRRINHLGPPELVSTSSPALPMLGSPSTTGRVLSAEADAQWLNAHFTRGVPGWPREWSWALGLEQRLSPPIPGQWGYGGSYDADYTGLASPNLPLLGAAVLGTGPTMRSRLLRMGNVGRVITVQQQFEELPLVGEFFTIFDVPVRVLAVPDTLPPVFVVGAVRVARDAMAALSVVGGTDFDPAREVILGADSSEVEAPAGFRASATLLLRKPDRLVVQVEASHPAYLVVAEAFEKGWRATVDDRTAPVLPANVLFRAVAIGAGRHRVEMIYRPPSVLWGAALTLAGLAAASILMVRGRRREPA